MGPQELLPTDAGFVPEPVRLCGDEVRLFVPLSAPRASCPTCGVSSEASHSSYVRCIADLPIADRGLVVHLHVRRFRCHEPTCPRKTFVEQVPALVGRYGRRTRCLRSGLEFLGLTLGGRPESRLCRRQKKAASRTTLLRLVRGLAEHPIDTPRELGIDEFASAAGVVQDDLDRCSPASRGRSAGGPLG